MQEAEEFPVGEGLQSHAQLEKRRKSFNAYTNSDKASDNTH
jgi:hypothetical protein